MVLFNQQLGVGWIRGFISFLKSVSLKVNEIALLEFELTHYDVAV